MLTSPTASPASKGDTSSGILKIAIFAVGGQGGAVLANWIADLARRGGYAAQMTSVAGVAQRTGATIYYIEMAPRTERDPVFALTPAPGDVDIVIAAELMEAGRAVTRGFVTPDRTTLIVSDHRILAVNEKQQPGDGRADSALVLGEIRQAALKCIGFDMQSIAAAAGSVISASLFGALARSAATPFSHELFEDVIRTSGRGVQASLRAWRASVEYQPDVQPESRPPCAAVTVQGPEHLLLGWQQLLQQVENLPPAVQPICLAGLRKVVDYQDLEYGGEYLQHLARFAPFANEQNGYALTTQAAINIANAMCYDDIIRVADLKTRASRNTRLYREQEAATGQIVHTTEYFHPRAREICATLPAAAGLWIEQRPRAYRALDRLVNKGRRLRSDSITGYLLLWFASALKAKRRKLLRHRYETAHLQTLLGSALTCAAESTEVASEILQCQRLVKGYSDTHSRGQSKFKKVMHAIASAEHSARAEDRAAWIKTLREAALQDEQGEALERLLQQDSG